MGSIPTKVISGGHGISPHFVRIGDISFFIYSFVYESQVFVTWSLLGRERTQCCKVAISCGSIQETDCQHQQHNHLYFHRKASHMFLQQRMVQYLEPRLGVRLNYIISVTYVFVSQHPGNECLCVVAIYTRLGCCQLANYFDLFFRCD